MKYFVVSDVHSYYTNLEVALNKAGFDINNSKHKLIICGDLFDRGLEAIKLYYFILELLTKQKVILIKGNHEDLLLDCLGNKKVEEIDFLNQTANTLIDFANEFEINSNISYSLTDLKWPLIKRQIFKVLEMAKIKEFIEDNFCNYYCLGKYIFVHGFLPIESKKDKNSNYFIKIKDNYLNASEQDWREARWLNGQKLFLYGKAFLKDKIIVCGHYSSSYGNIRKRLGLAIGPREQISLAKNIDYDIFWSDKLISLDATVMKSGKINVFQVDID